MPYDEVFYRLYDDYLQEQTVRKAHKFALLSLSQSEGATDAFDNVIDLGCGRSREYLQHGEYYEYVGVDRNVEDKNDRAFVRLIRGDYRKKDWWAKLDEFKPTAFVSLFSTEITAAADENYKLYRSLFDDLGVQVGIVSGFYYTNHKDENPVQETGDIWSYQALEPVEFARAFGLWEARVVLPVPSKLFGPDVIEVWKLLRRQRANS